MSEKNMSLRRFSNGISAFYVYFSDIFTYLMFQEHTPVKFSNRDSERCLHKYTNIYAFRNIL